MPVKFKNGKKMSIDMQTANMIVKSFDGLSWNLDDIIEAAFRVFSMLITGLVAHPKNIKIKIKNLVININPFNTISNTSKKLIWNFFTYLSDIFYSNIVIVTTPKSNIIKITATYI